MFILKSNKYVLKRLLLVLLIPLCIAIANIASESPKTVEVLYSGKFYSFFAQHYSRLFSFLPFSFSELLLFLLVLFVAGDIIRQVFLIIKYGKRRLFYIVKDITNVLVFVSLVYVFFIAAWGLNYYRLPFAVLAGYDVRPAGKAELEAVCKILTENANELRSRLQENEQGVMRLPYKPAAVLNKVNSEYKKIAASFPELAGNYGRPKIVVYPELMSYLGISGIYSPFTAEANVNMDIPDATLPSTACHEAAHLRGFAREDEANYIAYITCMGSDDLNFRYSGTLDAIIYSMNALSNTDRDSYLKLAAGYSDGVKRDLDAIDEYWSRYSGPAERASNKVNNAYLKSNKQADGVASYDRMVQLLIGQYRMNKLNIEK